MMNIVWDEVKRQANLQKHGFDFADVGELDWDRAAVDFARIDADGRQRFKAIGHFRNRTAAVIFDIYGTEAISVISFRQANAAERRKLEWPKS